MFPSNAKPNRKPAVRRPLHIPVPDSVRNDPATRALERTFAGSADVGASTTASRLFPQISLRDVARKRDEDGVKAVQGLLASREAAVGESCAQRGVAVTARRRLSEVYSLLIRPPRTWWSPPTLCSSVAACGSVCGSDG